MTRRVMALVTALVALIGGTCIALLHGGGQNEQDPSPLAMPIKPMT